MHLCLSAFCNKIKVNCKKTRKRNKNLNEYFLKSAILTPSTMIWNQCIHSPEIIVLSLIKWHNKTFQKPA